MATQNLAPEVESHFYDNSGPLFSMYLERAEEEDNKMAESWKGEAKEILLQTGLFSATVATMLSISIQDLKPNSQDTSAFYLANIYQLLSKEDESQVVILPSLSNPAASFTPPASAVCVNSLWFSSLVVSLTCALLATLLQQWARRYLRVTNPRYGPRKRARIRTFFAEGVERVHLPSTIEAVTTLLHIALFFFLAGLGVFLFGIHPTAFKVAIVWIGLCILLYAFVTVIPFFYINSPYHAPLSTLIWLIVISVRYTVFPTRNSPHLHHVTMPGSFFARNREEDRDQSLFPQNLLMRAEEYANGLPEEIDYRALSWTFDSLVEDRELEQFFDGVPGFCNSSAVDNPVGGFIRENGEKLSNALTGLMDHTLPSSLVPESVKQRRITICTKAMDAANLFGPWWILPRVLLGEWQAFLRSIDFGLFLQDWRVNSPITTYYAQCAVAVIISSVEVQARDDRWVQIVAHHASTSSVRSYPPHGDSILLANLIYIVRKTLRASSDIGRHWEAFIKNASSRTLESICKLDAQDSLPELQHDFCKLWNELVHAAHHGEHTYIQNLSLATLKSIRKIYIALHESSHVLPAAIATLDDSDAALEDIASYMMGTIDGHESSHGGPPNPQGQAGDAAQPPVSLSGAAILSQASVTSTTVAMALPTPSPSPPAPNTSQQFPAHQGAQPPDQCATHENNSAPQPPSMGTQAPLEEPPFR